MIPTYIRRHLLTPSLCRPCYSSLPINVLDVLFQLPAFLYANSGKYKLVLTVPGTLAWKIPWMEEPGRLQSMGLLRVWHDWATSLSLFTSMHWRRKRQPTPVFLLENPRDGGAWWAAVYGVAQSRTRLKWLSSSSSDAHTWNLERWYW